MSERDENFEHLESELMIQHALQKTQKNFRQPNGFCVWCQEETPDPKAHFCCIECREDHSKYWRARR